MDRTLDFTNEDWGRAFNPNNARLEATRGTSILGEVRNVEIPGPTQQLLCSKYHDSGVNIVFESREVPPGLVFSKFDLFV